MEPTITINLQGLSVIIGIIGGALGIAVSIWRGAVYICQFTAKKIDEAVARSAGNAAARAASAVLLAHERQHHQ